ncbi:BCCT family transporter [Paremcibacter congregatus]|uniref:BCCT family transporter n=1 Tax=Paremcibacter congregatus TaxID=2043170 RepID=UPI0030EF4EBA
MEEANRLSLQLRKGILPAVFIPSAAAVFLIVLSVVLFPAWAAPFFKHLNMWITQTFGWLYALSVVGFLLVALGIAFSRFGAIKLGADHETPRFSFASWVAMLFSAGMGIGLLFFSVAEPVMHYMAPPGDAVGHQALASQAMRVTFLHWGLHGWAVYAMIGLCLAYFGFRHNLPLTIRSALYPLIGDRIYGPIGHAVDVFAVLGTLFGVATSLGFGVNQVNAGLHYLFDIEVSVTIQVLLIGGITVLATASVVAGLDAGIKRLSELNLILALCLLVFVVVLGPTVLIFSSFTENLGNYLAVMVDRGLNVGAYDPDSSWVGDWTIFYWGWWISWSPFVGMFIARISRGRTMREFVLGVLFVPTLMCFFWLTAFGNTALYFIGSGAGDIVAMVSENMPVALFVMLEQLPLPGITSFLGIVLVITFFVTSSDSGSLVIDIITAGGSTKTPVWQRVFWAVAEGLVAATLLLAGGLGALQAATVATALPFTFVIILSIAGLLRGLSMEARKAKGADVAPDIIGGGVNMPWRLRLHSILAHPDSTQIRQFINDTARPALLDVMKEIQAHDNAAQAEMSGDGADLTILHEDEPEFRFAIVPISHKTPVFALSGANLEDGEGTGDKEDEKYFRAEVYLSDGGQDYDIYGYNREQIIHEVLNQYNRHLHYLSIAR